MNWYELYDLDEGSTGIGYRTAEGKDWYVMALQKKLVDMQEGAMGTS